MSHDCGTCILGIVLVLAMGVVLIYSFLRKYAPPVKIPNLDGDSFIKGHDLAIRGMTVDDIVESELKINAHILLGYKVCRFLLQSRQYTLKEPLYYRVSIGGCVDTQFIFMFDETEPDLKAAAERITTTCCEIIFTKIRKPTRKNIDILYFNLRVAEDV